HPKRLERQLEFITAHRGVDVLSSWTYTIDERDNVVGLRGHKEPWISADSVIWRNVICHPSVFGRTAWFRQNPYDPRYDGSEDYELWCRTLTKSRMAIIQEPLLFYRESGSYSLKKYLRYQWVGMRVKWRHGPEQVGYAGTAMLIAKALIQSA